MNAQKIVYATDFSESSKAALHYASALASESGALLYIVHVGEDSVAYLAGYAGMSFSPDTGEQIARENQAMLKEIEPTIPKVRFEHQYLTGTPDHEILAFAEKEKVDLIVLGSHGRTGISRLLLGSVAESIVRRAKCPVLTIKQPQPVLQEQPIHGSKSHLQNPTNEHMSPKTKHSLH